MVPGTQFRETHYKKILIQMEKANPPEMEIESANQIGKNVLIQIKG